MALRALVSTVRLQADTSYVRLAADVDYAKLQSIAYIDSASDNQWLYEDVPLSDVSFNVISKALIETVTLEEIAAKGFTMGDLPETISIADNFVRVVSYNRAFTDAFTIDDLSQIDKNFMGNKGNVTTLTDIIGLDHKKLLTDTMTLAEVVVVTKRYIRTYSDLLNFVDDHNLSTNKDIIGDNISFNDVLVSDLVSKRTLNGLPLNRRTLN